MLLNWLGILKQQKIRRILLAQCLADLATWLDFVIVSVLLVYHWEHDLITLTLRTLAVAFAFLLGGLFTTLWIDLYPPKRVMLATNLSRALLMIAYFYVPWSWLLLLLVFMKNIISSAYDPAMQVYIKYHVKTEHYLATNSISQVIAQTIRVVGPLAGGLLLTLGKPHSIFLLCSVLFILSAYLVYMTPQEQTAPVSEKKQTGFSLYKTELKLGLRYLRSATALKHVNIYILAILFTLFLSETFQVLLFKQLGLPTYSIGLLFALGGVGGILSALAYGQWYRNGWLIPVLGGTAIIAGTTLALIGHYAVANHKVSWIVLGILFVILGIVNVSLTLPLISFIQTYIHKQFIGRIGALMLVMQTLIQIIATLAGAALIMLTSVSYTFVISGYTCAMIGIIVGLSPIFWKLKLNYSACDQSKWVGDHHD